MFKNKKTEVKQPDNLSITDKVGFIKLKINSKKYENYCRQNYSTCGNDFYQ